MIVELKLNKEKVKIHNERIVDLKKEYPDFPFKEIAKLEDKFCPYNQFVTDKDLLKYKPIAKDNRPLVDFCGVYVCGLNDNHALERITNYREVRNFDSPLYWCNYGVSDNASQVLDYYENFLLKNYSYYMNDRKFVITMTPIFKEAQPEHNGWRWHKWGQYIGDFEPKHEYLYDEKSIDYVYCFTVLEVEEC